MESCANGPPAEQDDSTEVRGEVARSIEERLKVETSGREARQKAADSRQLTVDSEREEEESPHAAEPDAGYQGRGFK